MNQLDGETQQNAAASEQSAAAAAQLTAQSGSLMGSVEILKKLVNGEDGSQMKTESSAPVNVVNIQVKRKEAMVSNSAQLIPFGKVGSTDGF